jgi:hypothetical protein
MCFGTAFIQEQSRIVVGVRPDDSEEAEVLGGVYRRTVGERRVNCDNGFSGVGMPRGVVVSVLDGILYVTEIKSYLKVID